MSDRVGENWAFISFRAGIESDRCLLFFVPSVAPFSFSSNVTLIFSCYKKTSSIERCCVVVQFCRQTTVVGLCLLALFMAALCGGCSSGSDPSEQRGPGGATKAAIEAAKQQAKAEAKEEAEVTRRWQAAHRRAPQKTPSPSFVPSAAPRAVAAGAPRVAPSSPASATPKSPARSNNVADWKRDDYYSAQRDGDLVPSGRRGWRYQVGRLLRLRIDRSTPLAWGGGPARRHDANRQLGTL